MYHEQIKLLKPSVFEILLPGTQYFKPVSLYQHFRDAINHIDMSTKDRGENQRLQTKSDIRGLPGLRGQWSDVVRRTGPYGSEYNPLIVFHTGLDENVVGKLVEHLYLLDRTNGRLIIADFDVLDFTDQSGDPASLHRQINRFYRDFKDILPRYLIAWDATTTDFDPLLAKIAKKLNKRGIDPLYPLLLLPVTRKGKFASQLYQHLIALQWTNHPVPR